MKRIVCIYEDDLSVAVPVPRRAKIVGQEIDECTDVAGQVLAMDAYLFGMAETGQHRGQF